MQKYLGDLAKKIFFHIVGFSVAISIALFTAAGIFKMSKTIAKYGSKEIFDINESCRISTDPNNLLVIKCDKLDVKTKEKQEKQQPEGWVKVVDQIVPLSGIMKSVREKVVPIDFKAEKLVLKIGSNFKIYLEAENFDLTVEYKKKKEEKKEFSLPKFDNLQKIVDFLDLDVKKGNLVVKLEKDEIKVKNLNLRLKDGNIEVFEPIKIEYNDQKIDLIKLKGFFKDNILHVNEAVLKIPQFKKNNWVLSLNKPLYLSGIYDFSKGLASFNVATKEAAIKWVSENKDIILKLPQISAKTEMVDKDIKIYIKGSPQGDIRINNNKIEIKNNKTSMNINIRGKSISYVVKNRTGRIDIDLNGKKLFLKNVTSTLNGQLNGKNDLYINIPIGKEKNFITADTSFFIRKKGLENLVSYISVKGLGSGVLEARLDKNNLNWKLKPINLDSLLAFLKTVSNAEELKAFSLKNVYQSLEKNKKYMSNFSMFGYGSYNLKDKNLASKIEIKDFSNKYIRDYLNVKSIRIIGDIKGNWEKKLDIVASVFDNGNKILSVNGFLEKKKYVDLQGKTDKPLALKINQDTDVKAEIKNLKLQGEINKLKTKLIASIKEVKYKGDKYSLNADVDLDYSIKDSVLKANLIGKNLKGNLVYSVKDKLARFKIRLDKYKVGELVVKKIPDYIKLKEISADLVGQVKIDKKPIYDVDVKNGIVRLDIDKRDKEKSNLKIENLTINFDGVINNKGKRFDFTSINRNLKVYLPKKVYQIGKANISGKLIDSNLSLNYILNSLKDITKGENRDIFDSFSLKGDLYFDLQTKKLDTEARGEATKKFVDLKYSLSAGGYLKENSKVNGVLEVESSILKDKVDKNKMAFQIYKVGDNFKLDGQSKNVVLHIKNYKLIVPELTLSGFLTKELDLRLDMKNLVVKDKYKADIFKVLTFVGYIDKDKFYIKEPVSFSGLVDGYVERLKYVFGDKKVDISVKGILNNDLLSELIVFGIVRGNLKMDAEYNGTIEDFPKGIYVRITADRFIFRNRFLRDTLVAKDVDIVLKDGILKTHIVAGSDTNKNLELKIVGETEFRKLLENKPAKNKLKIYSKDISVRYKSIFRGKIAKSDLDVIIKKGQVKDKNATTLEQIKHLKIDVKGDLFFTGRLHMNKEFVEEFMKKDDPFAKRRKNKLLEELKKNVNLQVNIKTSDPLLLYGNFGSAYMNVDVKVKGSMAKPIVDGRMAFIYGRINLFGIKYNVDYFNVTISKNKPFINARLTTLIRETLIRITIYNTYKQPEVIISSVPPKPQRELLAMLFFKDVSSAVGNLTTGMLPLFKDIGALLRAILPSEKGREETEGIFNTGIEVSVAPEYSPTEGLIPFVILKRPLTKRFYIAISKAIIQTENLAETGWIEAGAKLTERSLFRYRKFDSGVVDYGFTLTTQFDF